MTKSKYNFKIKNGSTWIFLVPLLLETGLMGTASGKLHDKLHDYIYMCVIFRLSDTYMSDVSEVTK